MRAKPDPAVGFDLDVKIDPPDAPCVGATSPLSSRDAPVGPFEVALRRGYYDHVGFAV